MNDEESHHWPVDPHSSHGSSQLPVLKVEGLTVYQGSWPAIRDISFELLPGTDTAVVGPNGAGKSTLVKAILGLMGRSTGEVEIFGRSLSRLGNLRYQLGYVPQNFIFDRSFPISVAEVIGLGWVSQEKRALRSESPREIATPLGIRWPWQVEPNKSAAIAAALRRVDAYHLRHRPIGTLSTGQLKRVLLAYCLVIPRKLLILDEAFAGVDMQGEADFYTLLNQLKREQQWTVLQVSHDLEMVSHWCDRVLCLNQTLICSGTPEMALSPQNLLATYGPAYSRYRHNH